MVVSTLLRKLFRTIKTTFGQFFALAAIVAVGVAVYITMTTAFFNLSRSQQVFYEEKGFGDYFFHVIKAPEGVLKQIQSVPGVIKVTGRIQKDVPVMREDNHRATARLTSYPLPMEKELNRLHLLSGRMFENESGAGITVLTDPQYAQANYLEPGKEIEILAGGKKIPLVFVGTATSPEFIYTMKDAATMLPDSKEFGIIMISHEKAQDILNMQGQVNQVIVKLVPGVDQKEVQKKIEQILEPYGNLAGYPRKDQLSHAALDAELNGLEKGSRILPVLFFIVAAAIQFILLVRLIRSQRLNIGIMKALGYDNRRIILHFTGYALCVTTLGALLGVVCGMFMASGVSGMYAQFFNLPRTIGGINGRAVLYSFIISTVLGAVSGITASWSITGLNPADAMRPEPPRSGGTVFLEKWQWLWRKLHTSWKMSLRSIFRNRSRFWVTVLGVMSAVALLVLALFTSDSVDYMMSRYFTDENRYDYIVKFTQPLSEDEILNWSRWEGVNRIEPVLEVPVKIFAPGADSEKGKSKDNLITGLERSAQLKKVFNQEGEIISIPETGILVNERTAGKLGLKVGDKVRVETKLNIGPSRESFLKVMGINEQLLMAGGAFSSLETANRALGERGLITGVMLKVDPEMGDRIETRLKDMTRVASVLSKSKEKENIMQLMDSMIYFIGIMVIFALILGLAIIYNSSVMGFNERKRELASLRIIGLTNGDVSGLLFKEIGLQSGLGIALGLPAGRLLGELYIQAVSTEMYTMPMVVYPETYLQSAFVALIFVMIGYFFTVRRVKKLDLVEVLKDRE